MHMLCVVCAGGMLTEPPTPPRGDVMRPQGHRAQTCEDTWDVVVDTHHVRFSDTELFLNLL